MDPNLPVIGQFHQGEETLAAFQKTGGDQGGGKTHKNR
jgi:hypothetical protein